jgi:hypothetical protein
MPVMLCCLSCNAACADVRQTQHTFHICTCASSFWHCMSAVCAAASEFVDFGLVALTCDMRLGAGAMTRAVVELLGQSVLLARGEPAQTQSGGLACLIEVTGTGECLGNTRILAAEAVDELVPVPAVCSPGLLLQSRASSSSAANWAA